MFNRLAKRLTSTAAMLGAVAVLAFSGQAHAALYTGKWDPAFGAAFPDLGWRGAATFFVPDACLASDGFVSNGDACSGLGMRLVSAEVEFYKVSDPNNTAFHETLFFNTPSPLVAGMTISNGTLAGVVGTFGYYVDSALPLAGGPNTDFNLSFLNDIAVLDFRKWGPCEIGDHVFLAFAADRCVIARGISDKNPPDGAPFITFTAVPEPGSGALILLALAAFAFTTLRRPTPIKA